MSYVTLAIAQKNQDRMLAVATEKRHPQFPDVPTFRELGNRLGRRRLPRHRGAEIDAAGISASRSRTCSRKSTRTRSSANAWPTAAFELVDYLGRENAGLHGRAQQGLYEVARRMGLVKLAGTAVFS